MLLLLRGELSPLPSTEGCTCWLGLLLNVAEMRVTAGVTDKVTSSLAFSLGSLLWEQAYPTCDPQAASQATCISG